MFMRRHYCSRPCMHDAGCRWVCAELDDCGCTAYAKRRRVLRWTRDTMRVMRGVLDDNDLLYEFDEAIAETTLPEVDLDTDQGGPGEADETSDHEDESAVLRATVAERSEADVLHQLVNTAASVSERDQLRAENARLRALLALRS